MPLTTVPNSHYVRPHNDPAGVALERFLAGEKNRLPEDLALVSSQGREAVIRTMLDRFGANPTTGQGAPWNPPTQLHQKENHTYRNSTVLFGPELESLRQRWLRNMRLLKSFLPPGKRPITLLDYYGDNCFTTRMLRSMIEGFCGDEYDDFVLELRPSFDPGKNDPPDTPVAGGSAKFINRVKLATDDGGIIIAGGSFKSAYDRHGQFFQKEVMPLFLHNPRNRGLMICWAYQVLVQTIAEMYGMNLAILNGGLRWGTLPIKLLNSTGPLTNMFRDPGSERISPHSAVFTNTDHMVIDQPVPLGGKIMGSDPESPWKKVHMQVIASDALTDQPCAVRFGDRFFGFAFHGEALRGPHIEDIQSFVRSNATSALLERDYNISADAVAANFDPGLLRSRQSRIDHDLGPALYLATLDRLTRSLILDFKRSRGMH